MKLYNSLTRSVEEFKPISGKHVGIYSCGPTVYDRAHLGNMRTNILSDIIVRTLRFLGNQVTHVENITDIDDKTIARADSEGLELSELTARFESLFFDDLAKLNIQLADVYPRATEHYPEMKQLLNQLVEKGHAYEKNGEVYFDISSFKEYGKLSQLDRRQIKPGARVSVDEYEKDNPSDFVLWKIDQATRDHSHQPTKGNGRPGWHIECSAMSMRYLGPTIDIHIGGIDLLFPHHENEIAQSEAATGRPFARYFVHGEHLLVNGQRMSKSLNNYLTLEDIENRGFDPLAFRYLVLSAHYRTRQNFTWESLDSADRTLQAIRELAYRSRELSADARQDYLERVVNAIQDDLDTPKLLSILHEANSYDLWLALEPILGLGLTSTVVADTELDNLIEQRTFAKSAKDYHKADELRQAIEAKGYRVEDLADGTQRLIPKTSKMGLTR